MTDDVLQFVDSISATPTVRLDMNDATNWGTQLDNFDFSPPALRQARAGTLLVDGDQIPASSYGNRILRGTFEVLKTTIDLDATQIQLLNRELDRDTNYLKYQPNGATSPVFFRTLRSPIAKITEQPGSGTYKTLEFQIEAEPFALGLREDIAVGTVNNDPAAGSNGLFFDVTGVKGDVATPAVLSWTRSSAGNATSGLLAVRQHGTPSDLLHFLQCESLTLGFDTTNPGGGPDAAMSGTGTNNFVRTSFAGVTSEDTRLSWNGSGLTSAQLRALRGRYRLMAFVRRSGLASDMTIGARWTPVAGGPVVTISSGKTIPKSSARQIIDLGIWNFGQLAPARAARYGTVDNPPLFNSAASPALALTAGRTSGPDTLDWDCLLLVPADESLLLYSTLNFTSTDAVLVDGLSEAAYFAGAGSAFDGTALLDGDTPFSLVGGFPPLVPNQTNRFYTSVWASPVSASSANASPKSTTLSVTVSYWPRYLYIRPATT